MLLTKRVLVDPIALFEAWHALEIGLCVVPVMIAGAGYDYAEAAAAYSDLQASLDKARPGAAQKLQEKLPSGTTIDDVGAKLHASLTAIIAISWSPAGSKNQATLVAPF